jgi:hypothetical protein
MNTVLIGQQIAASCSAEGCLIGLASPEGPRVVRRGTDGPRAAPAAGSLPRMPI